MEKAMKKQYSGLTTERITVVCEFPLANSTVRMKAKTEVKDWGTHEESYEMGVDYELHSLGSSETAPISTGP